MKKVFSDNWESKQEEIDRLVRDFDSKGESVHDERNHLKNYLLEGKKITIKSFQKPNFINKIAYRFFRKSKARRSFEHAQILLDKDIGTPEPIAYYENKKGLIFGKSFYVSEYIEYDLTYREIIHDPNFPNRHEILKQFTRFTHKLHENGIEFLDHSPGNTLIIVNENNDYDFFLVDLNRMKFHQTMDYQTCIQNFRKLTSDKNMVATMSAEYAKITGRDYHQVFKDMWENTQKFQQHYHQRRKLKKNLLFWR
ncbi:MAG TPA: lipopolysaccharide kinase InaA family protein [Flavobacteriaceae bacterium]|nr:lipopolysaccharide kinase InaA family protein [Flavobacteriaceae bacterium]